MTIYHICTLVWWGEERPRTPKCQLLAHHLEKCKEEPTYDLGWAWWVGDSKNHAALLLLLQQQVVDPSKDEAIKENQIEWGFWLLKGSTNKKDTID